jgi:hypothetical protein
MIARVQHWDGFNWVAEPETGVDSSLRRAGSTSFPPVSARSWS